jgi:hypothetical protein
MKVEYSPMRGVLVWAQPEEPGVQLALLQWCMDMASTEEGEAVAQAMLEALRDEMDRGVQ